MSALERPAHSRASSSSIEPRSVVTSGCVVASHVSDASVEPVLISSLGKIASAAERGNSGRSYAAIW